MTQLRTVFAKTVFLVFLVCLFHVPAHAADPSGNYTVRGTSPGSSQVYTGHAGVIRTGKTFSVTWRIGNERYTGVGLLSGDVFSVSYYSSGHNGIAVYTNVGEGAWAGIWAPVKSKGVGREEWQKK